MKSLKIILAATAMLAVSFAFAQENKELVFNSTSAAMNKEIPAYVVLPDSYASDKSARYPVIYLLHGFGGDYKTWAKHTKPNLQQLASLFNVIFVCPEGARSWYWDSPVDPSLRYETYIANELIPQIDKNFRTISDRKARAITGFSMGGHGALWLAIRHQDLFGACGSLSGGVDIRPFPYNWDMAKSLGEKWDNHKNWDDHTVMTQLDKIRPGQLQIAIDCGTGDFFYEVNEKLHRELLYRNIPHDYTVRPGAHNHPYWNNAIDFQTLFFSKFFASQAAKK